MAEKNRTKNDYPKDSIQLVKAGLLFVAVKLGDLLDEIIVVGGVVPSLLVDQAKAQEPHVGTTDLDLGLSLSVLDEEVAGLGAMLVLKAFAFDNRGAEKDAYDIYYLLHELGVDAAVEALNRCLADKDHVTDVKDALALLTRDFSDMDSVAAGSVARFMNDESNEDLRADVVGAVGAVVRRVGI